MKTISYDEKYLIPCAKLLMQHYNSADFNCQFSEERAGNYLQELILKPRFVGGLLLDQNNLVGFVFGHVRTWSVADELYLDEFIIDATTKKSGLDLKLLDFMTKHCTNLSLAGMTTMTNVIALADFYQKNDFLSHEITFLYKGLKKLN